MGYDSQKVVWVMGYGLWVRNPCKPTWETEKCMGFEGVWVIWGMGYKEFDCTSVQLGYVRDARAVGTELVRPV